MDYFLNIAPFRCRNLLLYSYFIILKTGIGHPVHLVMLFCACMYEKPIQNFSLLSLCAPSCFDRTQTE
uniref:Uncharacterized protein n=1 Tax=Anguilla anguilla TaxID=7936 RepID=A0A0E9ST77_ANGAN